MATRAMLAGISGLDANQDGLSETAANIANVGTVGYKEGQVIFGTLLSEQIAGATSPSRSTSAAGATGTATGTGGVNPLAIGSGVRMEGVETELSEGTLQTTSDPTDIAITGTGYLVVDYDGSQVYTRDGSLDVDEQGNLTTSSGALVLGWEADSTGTIVNTTTPIAISIPYDKIIAATPTSRISLSGNLPAWAGGTTTIPNETASTTAYNSLGDAVPITVSFVGTTATLGAGATLTGTAVATGSLTIAATTVFKFQVNGVTHTYKFTSAIANGSLSTVATDLNTAFAGIAKFSVVNTELVITTTATGKATTMHVTALSSIGFATAASATGHTGLGATTTGTAVATGSLTVPATTVFKFKVDGVTHTYKFTTAITNGSLSTVATDLNTAFAGIAKFSVAATKLVITTTATGRTVSMHVTAISALGYAAAVTASGTSGVISANTWKMSAVARTPITGTTVKLLTTVVITFNDTGVLETVGGKPAGKTGFLVSAAHLPTGMQALTFLLPLTSAGQPLTQYAGNENLVITQNGHSAGTLTSYEIGSTGVIEGTFSNGVIEPIAQIALASFPNPAGLSNIGNNLLATTANSGAPSIGAPGEAGRGTLIGGELESSNVTLAQQLTNMITYQEDYEANTKSVSTMQTVDNALMQA